MQRKIMDFQCLQCGLKVDFKGPILLLPGGAGGVVTKKDTGEIIGYLHVPLCQLQWQDTHDYQKYRFKRI